MKNWQWEKMRAERYLIACRCNVYPVARVREAALASRRIQELARRIRPRPLWDRFSQGRKR